MLTSLRRMTTASSSSSSSSAAAAAAATTAEQLKIARAHCYELVRKADNDGYLATLMLPAAARPLVMALRALNVEVARVRDTVSNVMIGRMRMRFWKDAVDGAFTGENVSKNPVILALAHELRQTRLNKAFVVRLMQEREDRLSDPPFNTVEDVEQYGENTASMVLYLTLQACKVSNVHADHAASHAGKALGIVTQLRALPYHLQQRRLMLPVQLQRKHGLLEEDIVRGKTPPTFSDAIFDFATTANDHLITARSFRDRVPKEAAVCLLPAVACQDFLTSLEKARFDIFNPQLHARRPLLPVQLWRHKFMRTY